MINTTYNNINSNNYVMLCIDGNYSITTDHSYISKYLYDIFVFIIKVYVCIYNISIYYIYIYEFYIYIYCVYYNFIVVSY